VENTSPLIPSRPSTRVCAIVEYDGSEFAGWQTQRHSPSIQTAVETALSFVAGHPIAAICAGRTDAGVHAAGQVIHFESEVARSSRTWLLGANSKLPPSIALQWAARVDADFHARHSALRRIYRYCILNRSARSPLLQRRSTWIHRRLDAAQLHQIAQCLVGEHDFAAFRSSECQSKTSVRTVEKIEITRAGDCIWLEITARAFLHHMVRNIVGTLLKVCESADPERALAGILASTDRRRAGPTAAAAGLFLWKVQYPPEYGIPSGGA
jgi:tRNA pseudouridine38-40 synthase